MWRVSGPTWKTPFGGEGIAASALTAPVLLARSSLTMRFVDPGRDRRVRWKDAGRLDSPAIGPTEDAPACRRARPGDTTLIVWELLKEDLQGEIGGGGAPRRGGCPPPGARRP